MFPCSPGDLFHFPGLILTGGQLDFLFRRLPLGILSYQPSTSAFRRMGAEQAISQNQSRSGELSTTSTTSKRGSLQRITSKVSVVFGSVMQFASLLSKTAPYSFCYLNITAAFKTNRIPCSTRPDVAPATSVQSLSELCTPSNQRAERPLSFTATREYATMYLVRFCFYENRYKSTY